MKAWEQYPALARAVKKTHEINGGVCHAHDMGHVLIVAGIVELIAPDPETARLAGIAALCHNADRIIQKMSGLGPEDKVQNDDVAEMVGNWLKTEPSLPTEECRIVIEAILSHNKRNGVNDHSVLVTLMDADHLAIMSPDNIMRVGQWAGDRFPPLDLVHLLDSPTATWRNIESVFRATKEWMDWADFNKPNICIRLPKAQEMAIGRAKFLKIYQDIVIAHLYEIGVVHIEI